MPTTPHDIIKSVEKEFHETFKHTQFIDYPHIVTFYRNKFRYLIEAMIERERDLVKERITDHDQGINCLYEGNNYARRMNIDYLTSLLKEIK